MSAPTTPPRLIRRLVASGLALAVGTVPLDAVRADFEGPAPRAHAEGAPPGHTGGFAEPTCQTCHSEYEVGVGGRLTVNGLPDRWEPGKRYTVSLVLESAGMQRAGFQASFRHADGEKAGRSAGAADASAVDVAVEAAGGVTYLGHAPGGRWTRGAEVTSWTFAWTAPGEPGGPVAFHAAANSANGDNSPFGDIVYVVADTMRGPEGP